jgi:hypothetical protein
MVQDTSGGTAVQRWTAESIRVKMAETPVNCRLFGAYLSGKIGSGLVCMTVSRITSPHRPKASLASRGCPRQANDECCESRRIGAGHVANSGQYWKWERRCARTTPPIRIQTHARSHHRTSAKGTYVCADVWSVRLIFTHG